MDVFAGGSSLEASLKLALEAIVNGIEPAERGAVLLLNEDHTRLEFRAHFPEYKPAFSSTLAINTLNSGSAFVWKRDTDAAASSSIKRLNIQGGLYAPLGFGANSLGVVCVDSTHSSAQFSGDHLSDFVSMAKVLSVSVCASKEDH